jgi:glycosyltransferase involved in cell wall biosynthesis
MKKILVVAECINKDKTSEGIGTTSFLNALADGPFQIDCLFYQYPKLELENTGHIHFKIKLIKINNNFGDRWIQNNVRIRNFFTSKLGVHLFRVYRSWRFLIKFKAMDLNHYDLVITRTIAMSIASHAAMLKVKNKSFKWIVNFNDPVPISLMPYPYFDGVIKQRKHHDRESQLVKDICAACDGIATPSKLLTEKFVNFANVSSKKTVNWPHIFNPMPVTKDELLPKDKLNILHVGTLLNERDPSFLLEAFGVFLKNNPEFKSQVLLSFIGPIKSCHLPLLDKFEFQENLYVKNGRIPHQVALAAINEAEVVIILEATSDESTFMPGKLAEFLGLNKLVWSLSPKKSETRRILGEDYPHQTEANNIDEMVVQLERFAKLYENKVAFGHHNSTLSAYVSPGNVVSEVQRFL